MLHYSCAFADTYPWEDACSYPGVVPTSLQPNAQKLLGATALIIPLGHLQDMGDHYHLIESGPQTAGRPSSFGPGLPFCSTSLFYNAYSGDILNGRTAFMVGPNLAATAPHYDIDPSFNPLNYAMIFGFGGGNLGGSCSFNSTGDIPKSQVATAVVGGTLISTYDQGADFLIWQVQNVPANTPWVRLRSSGSASEDDIIASAQNPYSGFTKFQYGITYQGPYGANSAGIDPMTPTFFNFEAADGSSGSAFLNLTKGVVETVVRGGTDLGLQGDEPNINGHVCANLESEYDPSPTYPILAPRPYPDAVNTGIVQTIATPDPAQPNEWPTPEARVFPLEDVTYVLPVGGTATPSSTNYRVRASAHGATSFLTIAGVLPPPSGQPALLLNGVNSPYAGNLGTTSPELDFSVTTSVPATLSCGIYDRYVQVYQQGFTDNIRHRFEIGLKEVDVSPSDTWVLNDLGTPYSQTRTYTITNVRPTATTVQLTPGVYGSQLSFLTINGGGGTNLTLGPSGSPTSTQTFTIGVNQFADSGTTMGAVYHAFVEVSEADTVCGKGPIYLNVDFKRGEQQFVSATGPTTLPAPKSSTTFGAPVTFDFDMSSQGAFCLGDLNLDLGFSAGTSTDFAPSQTKIQITAPNGLVATIWNAEGAPNSYWLPDNTVQGFGSGAWHLLHLDDSTTPPLGPQLLGYLNGSSIAGHWHVDVSRTGTLNIIAGPARLDFTRAAACVGSGG
jgi:hypothetical protein